MGMAFIAFIFLILVALYAFYFFTKQNRKVADATLPAVDKNLLEANVVFYQKLDAAGKVSFENDVNFFLAHTRITGVLSLIHI